MTAPDKATLLQGSIYTLWAAHPDQLFEVYTVHQEQLQGGPAPEGAVLVVRDAELAAEVHALIRHRHDEMLGEVAMAAQGAGEA